MKETGMILRCVFRAKDKGSEFMKETGMILRCVFRAKDKGSEVVLFGLLREEKLKMMGLSCLVI